MCWEIYYFFFSWQSIPCIEWYTCCQHWIKVSWEHLNTSFIHSPVVLQMAPWLRASNNHLYVARTHVRLAWHGHHSTIENDSSIDFNGYVFSFWKNCDIGRTDERCWILHVLCGCQWHGTIYQSIWHWQHQTSGVWSRRFCCSKHFFFIFSFTIINIVFFYQRERQMSLMLVLNWQCSLLDLGEILMPQVCFNKSN